MRWGRGVVRWSVLGRIVEMGDSDRGARTGVL